MGLYFACHDTARLQILDSLLGSNLLLASLFAFLSKSRRLLELPLDIQDLWNVLAGSLAVQKGIVIPPGILSNLIQATGHSGGVIDFHHPFALGLQKVVKIVLVAGIVVEDAQQIVQCKFGKGNGLVHGIQVFGIHGGDQLTNEMESLGKGQCQSLIFQDLVGFVAEIIGFTAIRSNLQI